MTPIKFTNDNNNESLVCRSMRACVRYPNFPTFYLWVLFVSMHLSFLVWVTASHVPLMQHSMHAFEHESNLFKQIIYKHSCIQRAKIGITKESNEFSVLVLLLPDGIRVAHILHNFFYPCSSTIKCFLHYFLQTLFTKEKWIFLTM